MTVTLGTRTHTREPRVAPDHHRSGRRSTGGGQLIEERTHPHTQKAPRNTHKHHTHTTVTHWVQEDPDFQLLPEIFKTLNAKFEREK